MPGHEPLNAQKWGFEWTEELLGGWCSRVFANETRVLKVPWQGEEIVSGAVAYRRIEPWGPKVYEADEATGEVLMERLRPGSPLSELGINPAHNLIFKEFFLGMADLPTDGCIDLTAYYPNDPAADELVRTSPGDRFLHGDLHHHNILRHGDTWKVIDPKGLVGDPHFEPVAWLRNPIDALAGLGDLKGHIQKQLDWVQQDLKLDPTRVLRWAHLDSRDSLMREPEHPWHRLARVYDELI